MDDDAHLRAVRNAGVMEANLLQCVCGVCGEATGDYTKMAIPVTVRSGELRIRTWLCSDCMAKADDAQEANPFLEVPSYPPTIANELRDTTTDLRFNNT